MIRKHCSQVRKKNWIAPYYGCSLPLGKAAQISRALHWDKKVIESNKIIFTGLMISGMARGGQVLGDSELTQRATKAAEFMKTHMYRAEDNTLLRSCYTAMDGGVAQR